MNRERDELDFVFDGDDYYKICIRIYRNIRRVFKKLGC